MARLIACAAFVVIFLAGTCAARACEQAAIQALKDTASQSGSAGKYTAGSEALINASRLESVCANETSGPESYQWAFNGAKDAGLAGQAAHKGGLSATAAQFVHMSTQLFQRLRPLAPTVGDRSTIDTELAYNRDLLQAWAK